MPRPRASRRPSPARQPLSLAFGSRAKVGLLRILTSAGAPMTERDAARRAGLDVRSAQLALDDLVPLGLVRLEEAGRAHMARFNASHYLAPAVHQLFRREWGTFEVLRHRIVAGLKAGTRDGDLVSVALFGSVARSTDSAESDADILVIVGTANARERVQRAVPALREELAVRFGVKLSVLAYTRAAATLRWRRGLPLFTNAVDDALVLLGPPLRDVLEARPSPAGTS